jgi:hypothetical protein
LQSTRAIPHRDVFYVADPVCSIRCQRFLRFFAGARSHSNAGCGERGIATGPL